MINNAKKIIKSNKILYKMLLDINDNVHNKKNDIKFKKDFKNRILNEVKSNKNKKVYFLLDQTHGNMGDQAIGYAERLFSKENLKNYDVISTTEYEYKNCKKYIQKLINTNDIIVLRGGGSIGNQYISHEESRRDIINSFPNNKIISFPQTMFFSDDENGKKELEKTIDIYSKHKDLTIIAREEKTYKDMCKVFNHNNVILTPDIVLYLNKVDNTIKRDGVLFCFRDDIECALKEENKEFIKEEVLKIYNKVNFTDMEIHKSVQINERETELNKKFNQFRKAELVITDRLHGMVFATITGTPCIALSNYNHKVKGTYEWIKHLGYIKFVEDVKEIPNAIRELLEKNDVEYNNDFTEKYYNQIIDVING